MMWANCADLKRWKSLILANIWWIIQELQFDFFLITSSFLCLMERTQDDFAFAVLQGSCSVYD